MGRLAVGMGHGIEDVGHVGDAPGERDGRAGDPRGIAGTVPALVVGERDVLGGAQQRPHAAGQDVGPDHRVPLHLLEFAGRQRSRLQKDRVANADLADIVQGRRSLDRQRHLGGQSQLAGEGPGEPTDTSRVFAGVVVAELGGERQPLEDLEPRDLQLPRPFLDGRLEPAVVLVQLQVQEARDEQVADAQQRFDGVERLVEEVLGAGPERALANLDTEIGRHNENGEIALVAEQPLQLCHHAEAIEARHVQVQQNQVRTDLADQRRHLLRGRRRVEPVVSGRRQQPLEQSDVRRLIIDDQDPRPCDGLGRIRHRPRL